MKRFRKSNYGVASPLEFSIASMALISTIVVVTVSMSPPVEQSAAQFYADADAKATEIMSLLLTSESEIGMAIDPGMSLPTPITESVTDITIDNSPPSAELIYPPDGGSSKEPKVKLIISVYDADGEDLTVRFYISTDPDNRDFYDEQTGLSNGLVNTEYVCDLGNTYYWNVSVSDAKRTYESASPDPWSFSVPLGNPPLKPTTSCCPSACIPPDSYCVGTSYCFRTVTTDPEGDMISYQFDIDADGWGNPPLHTGKHVYTDWSEFIPSGQAYDDSTISWNVPDNYYVRSRAKDINGAVSDWSDPYPSIGVGPLRLRNCGFEHCFLEGTQIMMGDESTKNIEDIEIGDIIKSFNSATDSIQLDKVTEIYHDAPEQMIFDYYLLINDDLRVTPDHPILINDEWVQAEYLQIGDQFFKGEITSIEKIYGKTPSYNFETEKYRNYLVRFGDNIAIAHNGKSYVLTGNDEDVSLSRQTGVTENDYSALLCMDKIFAFSEMDYNDVKNLLKLPSYYDFYIKIGNSDAIYLNYQPSAPFDIAQANVVVTSRENVIIVDSVGYAYATLQVTVVK